LVAGLAGLFVGQPAVRAANAGLTLEKLEQLLRDSSHWKTIENKKDFLVAYVAGGDESDSDYTIMFFVDAGWAQALAIPDRWVQEPVEWTPEATMALARSSMAQAAGGWVAVTEDNVLAYRIGWPDTAVTEPGDADLLGACAVLGALHGYEAATPLL